MDYEQIYLDIISGVLSKELFVCDMENLQDVIKSDSWNEGYSRGLSEGYQDGCDEGYAEGYEQGAYDHAGRDV